MEQKYKIGDRVRIKSLDWYNENKDEYGDIDCGNVVFLKSMQRFCGRIVTIIDVNEVQNIYITVLKKDYLSIENHAAEVIQLNGEMIEGLVEEENNDCEKCGLTRNSTRCLFMDNCPHNKQKNIIEIPKDYVIKDENDNVINATKIVLEKKKEVIPDLQLDSIRTVREYCTEHSRIWLEIYEDNPKVCVFTHLLVAEDHRQKGYGTKALEQAEMIAKDLGCNTIHLKVETYSWMSKWYLRLGYKFLTNAEDNYTWLTKSI